MRKGARVRGFQLVGWKTIGAGVTLFENVGRTAPRDQKLHQCRLQTQCDNMQFYIVCHAQQTHQKANNNKQITDKEVKI